eukprot:3941518-Rhodomonas_salina.2
MVLPASRVAARTVTANQEIPLAGSLAAYAMFGTDIAYSALSIRVCYAMCGTDIAYSAIGLTRFLCNVRGTGTAYGAMGTGIRSYRLTTYAAMRFVVLTWAMLLRIRYAIPGTEVAYGANRIRACYAMLGTA